MARNEEKHFGKLNRLWLMKEREAHQKKHPKRPRLDELHTPGDISQWLPSIKEDIDFHIKQTEVTCYPERKIKEIKKKITHLEREYHSFARKLRKLDSGMKSIPWTPRPYEAKWTAGTAEALPELSSAAPSDTLLCFKRIVTPILKSGTLEDEHEASSGLDSCQVNSFLQDAPLEFAPIPVTSTEEKEEEPDCNVPSDKTCSEIESEPSEDLLSRIHNSREARQKRAELELIFGVSKGNVLGIDYSSSDEET